MVARDTPANRAAAEGYVGAQIEAVCRGAARIAGREHAEAVDASREGDVDRFGEVVESA